jgi:hypothetical protein
MTQASYILSFGPGSLLSGCELNSTVVEEVAPCRLSQQGATFGGLLEHGR